MYDFRVFDKIFITFCLFIIIYYTINCPCKVILSCHLRLFYTLMLIPILYVGIKNYFIK